MQEREKLREIEDLGEEDPREEPPVPEGERRGGLGTATLVQVILCLLALAGLLLLKSLDRETYGRLAQWYREEASQEIQLPRWEGSESRGEGSALPAPSAPDPLPGEDAGLQRI